MNKGPLSTGKLSRMNPMAPAAESVRADAIRHSFPSVVRSLGEDPGRLLSNEGLSDELLLRDDAALPYTSMMALLESAATTLNCPDFGLRLAESTPDGVTVLGPLAVAMRNAATLGDAFRYCEKHIHVYSSAISIKVEQNGLYGRDYMAWDVRLACDQRRQQTVEHGLGLTYNALRTLSAGKAYAQEAWFTHEPVSDRYDRFFSVPVRFNMPFNALFFAKGELDQPIAQRDGLIYEMARSYIDQHFPVSSELLSEKMRLLLSPLLSTGRCTQSAVADLMTIGARTLQRRLRDEGTTFEEIMDQVRRDIAKRCLADPRITMLQIIERLGYSETSVLTRSCHRWFGFSPMQMRRVLLSRH